MCVLLTPVLTLCQINAGGLPRGCLVQRRARAGGSTSQSRLRFASCRLVLACKIALHCLHVSVYKLQTSAVTFTKTGSGQPSANDYGECVCCVRDTGRSLDFISEKPKKVRSSLSRYNVCLLMIGRHRSMSTQCYVAIIDHFAFLDNRSK